MLSTSTSVTTPQTFSTAIVRPVLTPSCNASIVKTTIEAAPLNLESFQSKVAFDNSSNDNILEFNDESERSERLIGTFETMAHVSNNITKANTNHCCNSGELNEQLRYPEVPTRTSNTNKKPAFLSKHRLIYSNIPLPNNTSSDINTKKRFM